MGSSRRPRLSKVQRDYGFVDLSTDCVIPVGTSSIRIGDGSVADQPYRPRCHSGELRFARVDVVAFHAEEDVGPDGLRKVARAMRSEVHTELVTNPDHVEGCAQSGFCMRADARKLDTGVREDRPCEILGKR